MSATLKNEGQCYGSQAVSTEELHKNTQELHIMYAKVHLKGHVFIKGRAK